MLCLKLWSFCKKRVILFVTFFVLDWLQYFCCLWPCLGLSLDTRVLFSFYEKQHLICTDQNVSATSLTSMALIVLASSFNYTSLTVCFSVSVCFLTKCLSKRRFCCRTFIASIQTQPQEQSFPIFNSTSSSSNLRFLESTFTSLYTLCFTLFCNSKLRTGKILSFTSHCHHWEKQ